MRRGFTLIELLAVIIILGIIAVIAIPTISTLINESRQEAFARTVEILVKEVENKCAKEFLKEKEFTTNYIISLGKITPSLDIKGNLPKSGTISVDNNCRTSIVAYENENMAYKSYSDDKVLITNSKDEDLLFNYELTNSVKIFVVPKSGIYKIELWGSQGGSQGNFKGGKGAYTKGEIRLNQGEILYVTVGGSTTSTTGGYNGGGNGSQSIGNYPSGNGGGGATDIRINEKIESRIMVAAGGGGSINWGSLSPGYAGGLSGANGTSYQNSSIIIGATQTSGYDFHKGADAKKPLTHASCGAEGKGGGGAGYYGGYAQLKDGVNSNASGAGGSSYISGHVGSIAIKSEVDRTPRNNCSNNTTDITCSYHYSNHIFTNTIMKSGIEAMPSKTGSIQTGNTGNGFARITFIN